jgi:hypothetical protein
MDLKGLQLIRLGKVLEITTVKKSSWWNGVNSGIYPKPVYVGPKMPAWPYSFAKRLNKKNKWGFGRAFWKICSRSPPTKTKSISSGSTGVLALWNPKVHLQTPPGSPVFST